MRITSFLSQKLGHSLFLPSHGRGAALPTELKKLLQRKPGYWDLPELPEIGSHVIQGKEIAIVESVKAASEVYSPLTGEVLEVNKILNESPNMVNEDAEGKGWFIKLKVENISELNKLMEPESYKKYIEEGG